MKSINWNDIPLFKDFPQDWIEQLQSVFEPLEINAGKYLIEEGKSGNTLYILTAGKVQITKSMILHGMTLPIMGNNAHKVLATLDGSNYPSFGEIALLDEDIRSATIKVVEDSSFIFTDRERFLGLVGQNSELGCALYATLGQRLAQTVRRNNSEVIKLSTALALALSRSRS